MTRKIQTHVGSTLDDFLAEQGVLQETTAIAIKRVIAWRLAERMHTSRAHLDRLLNANDTGMTLETMARAAQALGRTLRVEFASA
jgi:plasmid maintenance system antidote protein VapI